MTCLRRIVSLVYLMTWPATVAAQNAPQRPQRVDPLTASVRGTVTVAGTGAPVRGAEVRLSSSSSYRRLVTTDGDGRYDIRDLPAGEYRLNVARAGFTSLEFGQRRPLEAATVIDLSEGESFTANVPLPKGGAIYGRVVDPFGEPVAGTRVQALRSRIVQGQRRLQSLGPGDQTDDTGAFRVYGLPPGDYFVAASVGPVDAVRRDPPIYYPGTASFAEAQPIALAAGAEATADFQLTAVRTARVSGAVLNSAGAPVEAMVALVSEAVGIGPSLEGSAPAGASALRIQGDSGPDGAFTLENVPPGPYTLTATLFRSERLLGALAASAATGRGGPPLDEMMRQMPETVSMPLVVSGGDVVGLTLVTRRNSVLTGRFVAAPGVVRPLPTRLRVSSRSSSPGGMSMMQERSDGQFTLGGVNGPFHLDVQGLPDGWAVSEITVDGVDVTDTPIDLKGRDATARVELTDQITSISGVVQSRDPDASHSVIVFADDETKWTSPSRYVRTTRADAQGRFEVKGLPPDERYMALAVDYLEDGEEQDPQFLERLRSRATSFSLRRAEQRSIWLDVVER